MISQGQDSKVESAWEDKEHLDPQQLWRAVRASLSSGMKIWIAGSCIFLWSKQNLWWHSATPKQVLGWSTAFFSVSDRWFLTQNPLGSKEMGHLVANSFSFMFVHTNKINQSNNFSASRFTLEMNPSWRPSWQGGTGPNGSWAPSTSGGYRCHPLPSQDATTGRKACDGSTRDAGCLKKIQTRRGVEVSIFVDLCHLNRGLGAFNLLACHQFQPPQQLPEKLDVHRMVNMNEYDIDMWCKSSVTLCYTGIKLALTRFNP